jgi:hypothetical protein
MEDIREKAIKILTETEERTSILDNPNIDYTEAYKDGQIIMQYITKWWFTNAKEVKISNLPNKYIEITENKYQKYDRLDTNVADNIIQKYFPLSFRRNVPNNLPEYYYWKQKLYDGHVKETVIFNKFSIDLIDKEIISVGFYFCINKQEYKPINPSTFVQYYMEEYEILQKILNA